jgi:hypothetical protein
MAAAAPPVVSDLEPVWSGHPVGFCLVTHAPFQFAAYYDAERRMTVAQRRLGDTKWTFERLPSQLGWDSHNYVTMALDQDLHLHVSGNMHNVPLIYFRSAKPLDVASLRQVKSMTGEREAHVTYPVFLKNKNGQLVFRYRDGGSGSGDDLYNAYDEKSGTWRKLLDGPLISGERERSAYAIPPKQGPDGRFHLLWVWRDTPDCATNHSISYARSDDLVRWADSSGKEIKLPITFRSGEIIDPVPPGGGLINVNRELGFDNEGRPVVTYHKYDERGDLNAYAARKEATKWRIVKVSDWRDHHVEFSGGGSISFPVNIEAVEAIGNGRLALGYHSDKGAGTWVLDEATLQPIPGAKTPPRSPGLPRAQAKVQSSLPGMQTKSCGDSGQSSDGVRYQLKWETLGVNRDRPREGAPPAPSMLRVVTLPSVD